MFEQELELEKRNSSVVPLLLIVVLILAIVGVAGYFVMQSRRVLSNSEASAIALSALKAQGPATIRFHTGMVKGSVDDKPHDPNYRLLEKAGLIKLGKDTGAYGTITPVALTMEGQRVIGEIPEVSKSKEKDGTDIYLIPIAERTLVGVTNVKMINPERAVIDFTWKWSPNKLGNLFDASGSMVKSFNTWDRATLIQRYGANFYHGDPTSVSLTVVKDEKQGWQVAFE